MVTLSSKLISLIILAAYAIPGLLELAWPHAESHRYCEEHQQIEHVEEAESLAAKSDSASYRGALKDSQHFACTLLSFLSKSSLLIENFQGEDHTLEILPAWIAKLATKAFSSLNLIRLSPKASPPSVF